MNFRTPFNIDKNHEDLEFNNEKSLTVPDQSFTIREILERFTSGIAPPISRQAEYDDEEYLIDENIDFEENIVDITEATEKFDNSKRRYEQGSAQVEKLSKEAKEREIERAVERRLKTEAKWKETEMDNTKKEE